MRKEREHFRLEYVLHLFATQRAMYRRCVLTLVASAAVLLFAVGGWLWVRGRRVSPGKFVLAPPRPAVLNFRFARETTEQGNLSPCEQAAANLPSCLSFGLQGLLLLWPWAARGRDDTVHPQVQDHLTVVILRMEGADNGDCETR